MPLTGISVFVHLALPPGFTSRGVGAIIIEATTPSEDMVGMTRIDSRIWADHHKEPFKRIVNFAHAQGTAIELQLAYADRKPSTYTPWISNAAGTHRTTSILLTRKKMDGRMKASRIQAIRSFD
ncbi:hypothetical protein J3R82DRAFT_422 [Butyriboletus roseoflavus]|nr:hypothetical protein J3R82DRAFT_422 [Butyriboletus roseoflavus]